MRELISNRYLRLLILTLVASVSLIALRSSTIVTVPDELAVTQAPNRDTLPERADRSPLDATLELLVPNGLMLVSTNARTVTLSWLKEQIAAASRRSTVLETPRPPVDFSSDRDCAKSLIVRFQ